MTLTKQWKAVLTGALIIGMTLPASASGLFVQGSKNFGATLGSGSLNFGFKNQNYVIAGISTSYFVLDNVELGIGYRGWFGGDPTLNQLTVPVTYYVPLKSKFRPYVGVFGRKTWSSDSSKIDDYNSYGGRVGAAMVTSRNSYVAAGWVQEYYDNCSRFKDCSNGYAEFTFGIGF